MNIDVKLCKCGCGRCVNLGKTYVSGHNKSRLGSKMSEEMKTKLRLSHLGKHLTQEQKGKMSAKTKGKLNWFYGKHHSEETKAKIGKAFLGKHLSVDHRTKISKANKGRKLTEEQRIHLSKINIGRHLSEETKAKISEIVKQQWFNAKQNSKPIGLLGKHHSQEAIVKMSKPRSYKFNIGRYFSEEHRTKIGRHSKEMWESAEFKEKRKIKMKGKYALEKNPAWLGGKSFEPYTPEFNRQLKDLIRMRDGYICQLCGIPETEYCRRLTCHHIDYDKKISLPSNLISLCTPCNSKVNKNREYWTNYFRELLNQRQLNPKAFRNGKKSIINIPQEMGKIMGVV